MGVFYKPTDLLISQETKGKTVPDSVVTTLQRKYGDYYYFVLSISKDNREISPNTGGAIDYNKLSQVLSFELTPYVKMQTENGHSIPLADFARVSTFGLGTATEVLLAFKKEDGPARWLKVNVGVWAGYRRTGI